MTDFRALCTELIQLDTEQPSEYVDWKRRWNNATARARAALAADKIYQWTVRWGQESMPDLALSAEPQGPTDEELTDQEIIEWSNECAEKTRNGAAEDWWAFNIQSDDLVGVVRAALARWGSTPPAPPLSPLGGFND